jgi:excinuclease Cho
MHLPARRRPEFEQARTYEYPTHLRAAIDDLPAAPGVYVFHGQEGDLPLYIGKSINLRQRVLSHLRNVDEARLLRQTLRISHIRTAGEMGALLLEASLIKQQQPLLNQKLRRNRQLCSLRMVDGKPEVVYSERVHDLRSSKAKNAK